MTSQTDLIRATEPSTDGSDVIAEAQNALPQPEQNGVHRLPLGDEAQQPLAAEINQTTPILLGKAKTNGPGSIEKKVAMVIERRVACVPNRAPDGTWNAFIGFCTATLEARGDTRGQVLAESLNELRPLARYALTMHALEGGIIELDLGDLRLCVAPIYGQVDPGEDLSLPPVAALESPSETGSQPLPQLTFFLTRTMPASRFEPLLRLFEAPQDSSIGLRARMVALDPTEITLFEGENGTKENTNDTD